MEKRRLAKYGMTVEDYDQLLRWQDGRCPACMKRFTPGRRPHIDHSHRTGEVRGLLCFSCNYTAGQLHEDSGWMRRMAAYLEYPPTRDIFTTPRRHVDAPPTKDTP